MASAAVSCSTPSMCNIKKNTARPQAEVQDAQDREATRVRGGGVEFTLGGGLQFFTRQQPLGHAKKKTSSKADAPSTPEK